MIKFENIEVFNFESAFRGLRNPLESWNKSDSQWVREIETEKDIFIIGEEDMKLALKLVKAGSEHAKFTRQIFVSMDITAPLYFYKEFDTYKISTVANSTSSMHKMGSRLLTHDDFSWDKITPHRDNELYHLNKLIKKWQDSNKQDKKVWRELIQDLPSSLNQTRTWTANYQVLRNMYFQRRHHKLVEWLDFCKMIEELPYSELITIDK